MHQQYCRSHRLLVQFIKQFDKHYCVFYGLYEGPWNLPNSMGNLRAIAMYLICIFYLERQIKRKFKKAVAVNPEQKVWVRYLFALYTVPSWKFPM